MKTLLMSDTHGHVNRISECAEEAKAELCIHAGDFGFYDAESAKALTQRELYLQVKHSDLPGEEKAALLEADAKVWRQAIGTHSLLGNFSDYLSGQLRFEWPVYAVWGNHDDAEVALRMIKKPVPNLNILHDKARYEIGEFALLGLGGNCTPMKAFTQGYKRLPGARCRPASVLSQYLSLFRTARTVTPGKPIILVTHVSPMMEPFAELLAWQIGATLTVSGHMGYPNGEVGKTDHENMARLQETFHKLVQLYPERACELEVFRPVASDSVITHINLPDAEAGYAILDLDGTTFRYEMRGKDFVAVRDASRDREPMKMCRKLRTLCVQEYAQILPDAELIISGEIQDADIIKHLYDRMLNCFGYDKLLNLFYRCCERTKKTYPELTEDYLRICRSVYENNDPEDDLK